MDPTLDQLRVLDAIASEGTFAAAGRRLHRATSAISYAVRQLEDALDLTLFDRSGHRAHLTPAGERVLAEARAVLSRSDALVATARELARGFEPRVLVVLDGVLPLEPVMRALRRFVELGTPTRVELKVEYLLGVHERFVDDDADLYLSLGVEQLASATRAPLVRPRERPGGGPAEAGTRERRSPSGEQPRRPAGTQEQTWDPHAPTGWQALPALEVLLVAAAEHPLSSRARRRSPAELAEHVELTVADSSRAGSARLAAIGSPSVVRLSDFHAKREALLGGIGFGWLPRHLADAPLAARQLGVVLFDEGFRRRFTPRLGWRPGRPPGRGAGQLARYLVEELDATTTRGRLR